jgi:hypothetical protein
MHPRVGRVRRLAEADAAPVGTVYPNGGDGMHETRCAQSAGDCRCHRYGDCNDVATLMGALLAAKGIASEYAPINTNPVYRPLPRSWG